MNKTALAMEKAVDEEESNRKYKFVTDARPSLLPTSRKLNETLGGQWMPVVGQNSGGRKGQAHV